MSHLLVLTFALVASGAYAQVSGGTSAANPSVATQRVLPLAPPRAEDREPPRPADADTRMLPPVNPTPRALAPEAPGLEPEPGGGADTLHVDRIVFEGATILRPAELEKLARPFEKRDVTLAKLQQLARLVRDEYRRRGYLFAKVLIPSQKVEAGELEMRVFEGQYGLLEIVGNRRYPDAAIQGYFKPAIRHAPVLQRQLVRSLVVVNELPGLTVRSVLAPGKKLGTTDLTLNVREARPVRGVLDYNNFGSRLVGRNRAAVGVTADGVVVPGDDLSVRLTEPFPTKSDPIYQVSYQVPVSARGDRAGAQYVRAKTRVGGVFAPLDQRGDVEVAAVAYSRAVERTPARRSTLSAALVSKTIKSFVLGDSLVSRDDLRMLSLAGTVDRSRGRRREIHQLSVNQGLGDFLNGRPRGDPLSSRAGAGNMFTHLNLDSTCLVQVGRSGTVLARASGQLSTHPLTVAELFAIGGADTVRGFVQAEYLGDEGYLVSAEYRHAFVARANSRLELAGFVDHGEASVKNPQPGDTPSRRLTGAGAGLRTTVPGLGSTRLDVARPISTGRTIEGDQWVLYASHFVLF